MQHCKNRLAQETSPYLQQHANNPVAWYPWNDETLSIAKKSNKPIFLSIGYASCHWCHVMAHESFEDEEAAAILNESFISIKVDREERPDLDRIYQTAHQLLTKQTGGWPLNLFLNPDSHLPFFSGTYFPLRSQYNLPSFKEVLQQIIDAYQHKTDVIESQSETLQEVLTQLSLNMNTKTADRNVSLELSPLVQTRQYLENDFDTEYGGFGKSPKFPQPHNIERLLCHWATTKAQNQTDHDALDMALSTLSQMGNGGIYDQIGGGFHRYSIDAQWTIPHFEKMLYDNGQLLCLYAYASHIENNIHTQAILNETGMWLMREMQAPTGGYYASLDADSEGIEGRYYYWQKEDIKNLLSTEEFSLTEKLFALDKTANFNGYWHLNIEDHLEHVAHHLKLSTTKVYALLQTSKKKLLQARSSRIPPMRDEKILTAWNSLAIKGMALAGHALAKNEFIVSAQKSVDFIYTNLWHNNRLHAAYSAGKTGLLAYLDDYAFLMDSLLTLLQIRWRQQDFSFLLDLADTLIKYFYDETEGGFFFTAHDSESLIQRPKPLMDEALPAGNGIACVVLTRLGHLLGNTNYLAISQASVKMAWRSITAFPHLHNSLLLALEELLSPPELIILRSNENNFQNWQQACLQDYQPHRMCFAITDADLPEQLSQYKILDNITAYICKGTQCSKPITTLSDLEKLL